MAEVIDFTIEINGVQVAISNVEDLENAFTDARKALESGDWGQKNLERLEDNLNAVKKAADRAASSVEKGTEKAGEGAAGAKVQIDLLRESFDGAGTAAEILSGNSDTVGRIVSTVMRSIAVANSVREVSENRSTIAIIANGVATKANIVIQNLYNASILRTVVSLNTFRIALISTGVGALVVGLGLLISAFIDSGDEAENTSEKIDGAAASIKALEDSLAATNAQADLYIERLKAIGAQESVIQAVNMGKIQDEINVKTSRMNELLFEQGIRKSKGLDLTKKEKEELDLLDIQLKNLNYRWETQKIVLQNILNLEKQRKATTTTPTTTRSAEQIQANLKEMEGMLDAAQAEDERRNQADYQMEADKLEFRKKNNEAWIILETKNNREQKDQLLDEEYSFLTSLFQLKKKYGTEDVELLKQIYLKEQELNTNREANALEDRKVVLENYSEMMKGFELAAEKSDGNEFQRKQSLRRSEISLMESYLGVLKGMGEQANDEAIQLEIDLYKKKRELREDDIRNATEATNAVLDVGRASLQSAMELEEVRKTNALMNTALTEAEREKIAKDSFEKQKKLQLGMAYIDAAKSITSIIGQYPKFDGGIAMYAALASTAILNFGAIRRIKQTQYEPGSAGAGSDTGTGGSKFATGGLLIGPAHGSGGIRTSFGELEGGEFVVNRRSTERYAPLISAINMAGGGKKYATGGVLGDMNMADDLLDKVKNQSAAPIKTYVVATDMSSALEAQTKIRFKTTL